MINAYDFDGTIYDGDSSVDFYKFCLKKNKKILLQAPTQLLGILLYILGIIDKTEMKERIFSFLKRIDNPKSYIDEFWDKHEKKIKKWYLKQKQKSDLIISASPEFLLKPITKKLNINLIASKQDINTGKYLEKNCHDVEKVRRYKEKYKDQKIKAFYSDSMADKPMMDLSEEAYYVKKDTIYDLKEDRTGKIARYLKIDKWLFRIGVLYLAIPVTMQLLFWYNRIVSVVCVVLLLTATVFALKKYKPLKQEEYYKIFNSKKLLFLLLFIIIINLLSGAGGIFPQNWDYHGRNAIFRDLIENPWPVRYDYSTLEYEKSVFGNGGILNYYFAFWLPGAAVGKILSSFKAASLFMLLWQTLGTILFFYYIFRLLKNTKYRYFFIFMTFGGLNVIGHIIMNKYWGQPIHPIGVTHIDTSMGTFCMSTFITQLFWVFNQSIPAWIALTLFLQEKDYRTCGYYFALLVPFAPFPMLGLLYLIFCYIIFGKKLDKLIDWKRIKELLTIENFMGCISVLPVVFMYTLNESHKGCHIIDYLHDGKLPDVLFCYAMFVLLEFLIYIVIVNKKNYKQIIMCFLFFAIAPLFYIGGPDLGNRSTIPPLIILFLLVCQTLNKINKHDKKQFRVQMLTIIILLIASVTNFNEVYRSLKNNYFNRKYGYSNYSDSYQTFRNFKDKEVATFITNFVVTDDPNNKMLQWILKS